MAVVVVVVEVGTSGGGLDVEVDHFWSNLDNFRFEVDLFWSRLDHFWSTLNVSSTAKESRE